MRETAGIRLRRFPAQQKEEKTSEKQRWIEYLRQTFLSFFPL